MSYKILVVDDEPIIVKSVTRALSENGYTVFGAQDGTEALALAKKEKPDLIILDIRMPGMSGFDVLEKLRADEVTRPISVIMFTTKDEADDVVKCMVDGGALDYIVKPFIYEELLDRLHVNIEKEIL